MKFKVGDKVRIVKSTQVHKPELVIGEICEIDYIDETDKNRAYELNNKSQNWVNNDEIELVHREFTKQELLDMPVGTKIYTDAKDEDYQEYVKKFNKNFEGKETTIMYGEINNDLTITDNRCGTKIIKIEEPTYEKVYEYKEEPKEMTIGEIEKALGYSIKVIKED